MNEIERWKATTAEITRDYYEEKHRREVLERKLARALELVDLIDSGVLLPEEGMTVSQSFRIDLSTIN